MSTKTVLEKVIVVGLVLPALTRSVAEEHLAELEKLVETAGGTVVDRILAKRPAPDSATFIGKGKAEQLKAAVERTDATLVVFDDDLSPAQARNLAKVTGVAVIDRSGLILDIFAGRARSREARTQVELAQLEYMLPRLTRAWTHLERQAGGIGTRGVGETQLELDRRIIRNRIAHLKTDLRKIERTRETQRKGRGTTFVVALVGYTNAGKSTLFNRLAQGDAVAVDKLFATLDAKTQRIDFDMPRETVVVDTVGFIRKLPHDLVASFRSTMEEAVAADLVLHVIDVSHPQFEEQRQVGEEVLRDLGVAADRVLEVLNKIDRAEGSRGREVSESRSAAPIDRVAKHRETARQGSRSLEVAESRGAAPIEHSAKHRGTARPRDPATPTSTPRPRDPATPTSTSRPRDRATISALTGEGIEQLVAAIKLRELKNGDVISLEIPHNDSRMIAKLHEVAEVYEQRVTDHAMLITAWVPRDALHLFDAYAANVRRVKVS